MQGRWSRSPASHRLATDSHVTATVFPRPSPRSHRACTSLQRSWREARTVPRRARSSCSEMPDARATRPDARATRPDARATRRKERAARREERAARREERAEHRHEWVEHPEERVEHPEVRAEHPKEQAEHPKEQAELLSACLPSLSVRRAMPHELAGELSSFVEHPSLVGTASLRLRRASQRRRRGARGRASEAFGARSASVRLSRGARRTCTASLRTGRGEVRIRIDALRMPSDALRIRIDALRVPSDARPLRRDARRKRSGAFGSAHRSLTRGQRRPDRAKGCRPRTSAWSARSSGRCARSSGCSTRSSGCSTHSQRRCAKAKTPFTKSYVVITHFTECPTHSERERASASGAPRSARRCPPRTSGCPADLR